MLRISYNVIILLEPFSITQYDINMSEKQSAPEKLWRFSRNINALGGAAIAGAALLIPGPNAVLATWAGWNFAQAGGSEYLRQRSEKKRKNK